jgi:ATP-dependent helicase/nuclease subunit B
VPSFYALDVVRAITGEIPDHRQLARDAAEEAGASLAWPAPKNAARAIDDLEHDLASLKPMLESRDPALVRGHAHYLLQLNESLRRSVISRWTRGRKAWSQADGLVRVAPAIKTALETRCPPCSASRRVRTSSCSRRYTGSSRATNRNHWCGSIL